MRAQKRTLKLRQQSKCSLWVYKQTDNQLICAIIARTLDRSQEKGA